MVSPPPAPYLGPLEQVIDGAEVVVYPGLASAPHQVHVSVIAGICSTPMAPIRIVALEGDQTGQELLEQALRVIDPAVIGLEVEIVRFDLSLDNRRRTLNAVCEEAAAAMTECGSGLKAATITPEGAGDVGSPNRILREAIGGKVILRTGRRIPGVTPIGGVHHPIAVCRMAVGDAYGAEQWREGTDGDELAHRAE